MKCELFIPKEAEHLVLSLTREQLEKILNENKPNFGHLNQRLEVVGIEDAGNSFEPRLKITYDVYDGESYKGVYMCTLVLSKDYQDVECIIDGKWLDDEV